MVCLFADAEQAGFGRQVVRTAADLTAEQAQGFAGIVTVLAGMAEPWQAVFVRARLESYASHETEQEDGTQTLEYAECVTLEVEAVNGRGSRRRFDHHSYPQFVFTDAGSVELFKDLTTKSNEQQ